VPLFPECCTRGRGPLPSAALYRVLGTLRHSAKPLFSECYSFPSATLEEDWLCQVPDFWHSGKPVTLGEFCLSRSGLGLPSSLRPVPLHLVHQDPWRKLSACGRSLLRGAVVILFAPCCGKSSGKLDCCLSRPIRVGLDVLCHAGSFLRPVQCLVFPLVRLAPLWRTTPSPPALLPLPLQAEDHRTSVW